jgi:hypothetical protein
MEMAQDRLEKYVWSPTDKRVAAYLTPVWGDIPANSEWISLPGQAVAGGENTGRIERRRRSVNKVDQTLTGLSHMRKPLGKCARQDIRNNG